MLSENVSASTWFQMVWAKLKYVATTMTNSKKETWYWSRREYYLASSILFKQKQSN